MRPLYGMAALALLVAAAIGPVGAAMPLVSFTIDDGFPAKVALAEPASSATGTAITSTIGSTPRSRT